MDEIINQIKEIAGVDQIYSAGQSTLVITINLPNEKNNSIKNAKQKTI